MDRIDLMFLDKKKWTASTIANFTERTHIKDKGCYWLETLLCLTRNFFMNMWAVTMLDSKVMK